MDLSIVIVSYNTRALLQNCLNALSAATVGLTIETFVVDNASSDDSAAIVATNFPCVHLLVNRDNVGFARANNQALVLSRGRHVLCLNPDTEAEPGSLTTLVRFLDEHPETGVVGPKLLNSNGSLQPNGRRFPTPLAEFLGHSSLRNWNRAAFDRMFQYGRDNFDIVWDTDEVSGACLMIRRTVMEQIGMFDEDFFMFYEEIEWCWRIRQAGWKVVYVPQARVIHHRMGSVRQYSRVMTVQLFRSQRVYYRKTAGLLARVAIVGIMLLGLAKNELLHLGVAVKQILRRSKAGLH